MATVKHQEGETFHSTHQFLFNCMAQLVCDVCTLGEHDSLCESDQGTVTDHILGCSAHLLANCQSTSVRKAAACLTVELVRLIAFVFTDDFRRSCTSVWCVCVCNLQHSML